MEPSKETAPISDPIPLPSPQEIKEQLEIDKLKYEITLLQKQTREGPKATRLEKFTQYLKKNIGQISALIIFIGGVTGPVFSFFEAQRKNQLIQVNSEVLKIFEKDSLTEAAMINISVQDPGTVIPFLFNELNHYDLKTSKIKPDDVVAIYTRMYQINTEIEHYTWPEKVSALFGKSNQEILTEALHKNALLNFEKEMKGNELNQSLIIIAYLKLIYNTHNEKKEKFQDIISVLEKKCTLNEYKIICRFIEQKKS